MIPLPSPNALGKMLGSKGELPWSTGDESLHLTTSHSKSLAS